MWSGCLGDIEWGMCEVRDPLGNALKMVKKHIKSAEKSNNQNGWRGIKQSKSHKYHFPIPLVFRIKTIKIPGKSREMESTAAVAASTRPSVALAVRRVSCDACDDGPPRGRTTVATLHHTSPYTYTYISKPLFHASTHHHHAACR